MATSGGRPRDVQRSATYQAETRAFAGTLAEFEVSFATLESLVVSVTSHRWWREHSADQRVLSVELSSRASMKSYYDGARGRIRLASTMLTVATLGHELAHAFADDRPAHGPKFRAAEVELIRLLCGDLPAQRLADEFTAAGLTLAAVPPVSAVVPLAETLAEFSVQPDVPGSSVRDVFAGLRTRSGAIAL